MNQAERINSFSYIRAIACIAIIVLHTFASASILFWNQIGVLTNAWSRAISNVLMWTVPCFVMTTGALLLEESRKLTYEKLFKKYILRILAALVIFTMVFRGFDMIMDGEQVGIGILLSWIYELFTGTSWSHLWYLYLLIGLYFMMPFYRKIAQFSEKFDIRYLLIIYVVFVSVLPLTNLINLRSGFYIHVSTIYPFYLFCGYAIHKGIIKVNQWLAVAAVFFSSCLIVVLTIIRWTDSIDVMEQLWGYSSIFVVVQAVGIFALFDKIKGKGSGLIHKFLLNIDRCSFGIYLIHMIFIRWILRYMSFNPYKCNEIINFFLLIIGIFIISYFCTWILKKIPILKNIL